MAVLIGVWTCFISLTRLISAVDEGSFWHVTDFHYDFSYSKEAHSCNKKVPIPSRGEFGSGWCDSPWSLVNSSVYAMRALDPDVDFIIWTGDNVLHTKNEEEVLSTDMNVDILNNVTSLLARVFPGTVTYPAYGNHDYFPDAQFPDNGSDLYRRMEESWRIWINSSSASETLRKGGYFTSLLPSKKVRIVSLNTNLYYNRNKQVTDMKDPAGQFAWLESVLSATRNQQQKAVIIGHVPPGIRTPEGFMWFYPESNSRLIRLLSNYSDVIAAIHLGHDHEAEFKVIYDSMDEASIPVFLGPSVTPWRYVAGEKTDRFRNPGVRLVKYDRQTGAHLDYTQYYLDLNKANEDGRAAWQKLFQFSEAFQVPDISGRSLGLVREQLLNGGSRPTQTYYTQMVSNGDTGAQCDDTCRNSIYCGMRYFEMDAYKDCVAQFTNGSNLRRFGSSFVYVFLLCIHLGWQSI